MMRKSVVGSVALIAVLSLVLGGCDSDSNPRPAPSTTTATPPPDIPITGPANSPITWEIESGVPVDDPWVKVLQRFIAYDTYITSLPEDQRDGDDAAVLASGYPDLAAGEELKEVIETTTGYLRGGRRTGPLWIRVTARQATDAEAQLVACSDERHHAFADEAPVKAQRPFASLYTLSSTEEGRKVIRQRTAPKADLARCRTWDISRHTPRDKGFLTQGN